MKILLANHRYFMSGGPERYLFGVKDSLEAQGHQVVPFALRYSRNLPSPYSHYFADPPMGEGEVYFTEFRPSLAARAKAALRVLHNPEARRKAVQAIRQEAVELVYALQLSYYLYEPVVRGAAEAGVPVVCRMSDFQLTCPAYVCNRGDRLCEECHSSLFNAVRHGCLQGSRLVSGLRVASMYLQRLRRLHDRVAAFVTPSAFLRQKMIDAGFDGRRILYLPTPVDLNLFDPAAGHEGYVLYVGNLRRHKGVECLLQAASLVGRGVRLLVVARCEPEDVRRLQGLVGTGAQVEFLGARYGTELVELYRQALCVVVPSICYENLPNVALEAMACAKAVIGSRVGAIPEAVTDGETGLLFEPGNSVQLAALMERLLADPQAAVDMGREGRLSVERKHNPMRHSEQLTELFNRVIMGGRPR